MAVGDLMLTVSKKPLHYREANFLSILLYLLSQKCMHLIQNYHTFHHFHCNRSSLKRSSKAMQKCSLSNLPKCSFSNIFLYPDPCPWNFPNYARLIAALIRRPYSLQLCVCGSNCFPVFTLTIWETENY